MAPRNTSLSPSGASSGVSQVAMPVILWIARGKDIRLRCLTISASGLGRGWGRPLPENSPLITVHKGCCLLWLSDGIFITSFSAICKSNAGSIPVILRWLARPAKRLPTRCRLCSEPMNISDHCPPSDPSSRVPLPVGLPDSWAIAEYGECCRTELTTGTLSRRPRRLRRLKS